jgi:NAD(P)H dehydrogenase (quinone)
MAAEDVSIVIVYDSGSRGHPSLRGRTEAVAKAIAEGARAVPGTEVTSAPVASPDRPWESLDAADAIVFGCPTYMGSASAALKAFMEESLRPQWVEQRWKDKLAAGFTNSAGMSGDKLLTLHQLAGFAAQHGMLWLSLGEPPGWQDSSGSTDDVNRLSSFLGLMSQSNSDQGPDTAPPASDRETARRFGERIATTAHEWRRGRASSLDSGPPIAIAADDGPAAVASAQLVLAAFRAVEQRDHQRLLELYHPEVEFHWPASLPYGGSFRGADERAGPGWQEVWEPLQPTPNERALSPRLVAATPDEVVVLWRQRGVTSAGARFDGEVLGLYQIRDGKFARAQMFYFDTAAALRFLDEAGVTAAPASRGEYPAPTAARGRASG